MYVGAIVTIANRARCEGDSGNLPRKRPGSHQSTPQLLLGSPFATWDVLGQSVLDRTLDRLRVFGIDHVSVISEDGLCRWSQPGPFTYKSSTAAGFWPAWDSVVSQYLNHGMATLLLVRLGPYVELDVSDFLRFHRESRGPLTQAHHSPGPLDLVAVDAKQLRNAEHSFRARLSTMIANRREYKFNGYLNALAEPADFRRLVEDALRGRCGIRPIGQEVEPGIWVGQGAQIERSANVLAPAYIGANSYVRSSCTISGASAVEKQCEVDCTTSVDNCCILPGTYLGMGLNVSNAIVGAGRLFHLGRGVELQMNDDRLIGITPSSRQLTRSALAMFGAVSTRASRTASLMKARRFGHFR
ncbi:MAG: hypothetical protein DMG88_07710 [Acidobacteria bacterium]|nr:MAG: hypothetical protein DMG88_07710 [Acidobacteriota bacterium]